MTEIRTVRWEMALTRAELLRLAPLIDPNLPTECVGDGVRGGFGGGAARWSIVFEAPRERVIAGMRFPIADVTLRLEGFDDDLAERFLARFHLVFRKGGG